MTNPTITGTLAGQTTASEAPVTPFSGVTITDANDGGTDTDTLSITLSGGGTLTDGAGFAGTSSLSGSNGSYTLTGTAVDITTELAALSFTPVNGVPNSSVTTTFTLNDTSSAGATSGSNSVTTVIDHDPAVAPTVTGTLAGQTTVSDAPVTPFSHVTIADANNGGTDTDTLSITLSGGGTLGGPGLSGSSGSYTLTGTAADITAELDALSFTPAVNGVPNTSATTSFALSDTSTAGTTSASNSVTTVLDYDPVTPFAHVTITEPNITDPGNGGTETLSIAFSGGGTLTDGADFGGARTLSGSNGSYTLTGTAADINAELDVLSFTPVSGVPNTPVSFTLSDQSISTVVVSFTDGADGAFPKAGLISDAAGNLLGTTSFGDDGAGTEFELVNIGTVSAPIYSGTPTTLWTFTGGDDGAEPLAGLTIDAAGDLLGTTSQGGSNHGTVFEIANTGTVSAPVYSSTLTTLVSFQAFTQGGGPDGGLISDAAGDLFGTTSGGVAGPDRYGTVFEIANTGSVNAPVYGTLTTLVHFNVTDSGPTGGLTIDAAGDLFGTTDSIVFELANTGTVSAPAYSSTPTTLVTFNGPNGSEPDGGLIIDAAGHLFGTTSQGGDGFNFGDGFGTVFEIANGTLTTLVSFVNSFDSPALPEAGLIIDAAGDLFGTTVGGGVNNFGTVFELVNTGSVGMPAYNESYKTLWSFTGGADGAFPYGSLTTDAAGDLFGTTYQGGTNGGPNGDGAVFELVKTASGYTMAPSFTGTLAGQTTVSEAPIEPFSGVTISDPNNPATGVDPAGTGTDTLSIIFSGGGTLSGTGLSGSNGHYTLTGTAAAITTELDALSFTPSVNDVPNTQATTHFTLFDQGGATPKVLASFDDTDNGGFPLASPIVDAAGDLFGTTSQGGPGGAGTVFEIANTGSLSAPVYSTPTTLVSFTGSDQPDAGLISDAAGDLFGTRSFFDNTGSVFELVNTGSVSAPTYSSTPTTLVSFDGTDGGAPVAGLILDAAGNLFGTTDFGGPGDHGTVFEIANTGSVSAPLYSSTPTTLWFFTGGADGQEPRGSLISDAAGDLFGTTSDFEASGDGTVFELVNTGSVSAPTYGALTTLVSFNGDDGADPLAGLMRDAAGDLFGTTIGGGPGGLGNVFELVNIGTVSAPSYGSTPATLVSFTGGADGSLPFGGVVSDAAGDLFGTTYQGGARADGTVFEIVNTGSVSAPVYSHTPTTLWAFTGGGDGANPEGGLTIDAGGNLFGTTSVDGTGGVGTAFELVKTGSVYTFLSGIDTTTSVIDSDPAVAPTITGTIAGQTITDKQTDRPFSGVTIGDTNNGGTDTDALTVMLDHTANGTLSNLGGGSYDGATGIYSVSGTAAVVTAALEGLVFTPTAHQVPPDSTVTTTFTIAVNDGVVPMVTDVNTTVVATAVNDPPTLTAIASNPTYVENSAPATLYSGADAATVEAGQTITSMTLTVAGLADGASELLFIDGSNVALVNGNSIVTATNGLDVLVSVSGSTATATFTGASLSAGAFDTLVDGIGYSDSSDAPATTDRTVTITQIVDSGPGTSPDVNTTTLNIASTVHVQAVDDAPVAVMTTNPYAATENVALDLKNTGMSVSDVDAQGGIETVTLSASEGTLTLVAGTSGAVIDSGNGTGSITFHGTIAELDALLNTDGTSAVSYIDNNDNPAATALLTLSINDGGHTGTGGPLTATATSTVDITAVNDAPVALIGTNPYHVVPGTELDLKHSGMSVSDVDGNNGIETVTLSVSEGALTLAAGTSGAVIDSGNGTDSVAFHGTIAQLDALLNTDGTSAVSYIDTTADAASSVQLSLSIDDGGHTGSGGPLTDTATSVITGPFTEAPGAFDFNFNDGHAEVLLQSNSGAVSIWDNGIPSTASTIADSVPSSWHIAGVGDFDGNGTGDILWQNDNGSVAIWDNGVTGHTIATGMPSSWHVAGTGDFNGDGKTDILWQNDNGSVAVWDSNNAQTGHTIAGPGSMLPTNEHVVATGDFSGDGKTDILWQNTSNGALTLWSGENPATASVIATSMPSSWHVAGVGDFDGSGKSDLLWTNDNGSVAIWDNGLTTGHIIATGVPSSWHVAGVGDFNGDGKSDILWHNDNGAIAIWDSAVVGHTVAGPGALTPDWHIIV